MKLATKTYYIKGTEYYYGFLTKSWWVVPTDKTERKKIVNKDIIKELQKMKAIHQL